MFAVNPTFPLGQLVMTRGVNDLVADDEAFARFVTESLARHVKGDWGELGDEDKTENDLSLKERYCSPTSISLLTPALNLSVKCRG